MKDTFKLNKDFRRLYGRGRSSVSPYLVTYVLPTERAYTKIGITVSKKLGGAVQRNRAKRLIRAAWAEVAPQLEKNVDVVFVARTRLLTLKSTDIASIIKHHMKNAEIPFGEKV